MYDPEKAFAANAEFDKIQERIGKFAQNIMPYAPSPEQAAELGEKMKMCVEVLRRHYDDYLNEFDPDKKQKLHKVFHARSEDFLEILKGMAGP
jgi:hypothetical protein